MLTVSLNHLGKQFLLLEVLYHSKYPFVLNISIVLMH